MPLQMGFPHPSPIHGGAAKKSFHSFEEAFKKKSIHFRFRLVLRLFTLAIGTIRMMGSKLSAFRAGTAGGPAAEGEFGTDIFIRIGIATEEA